MNKHIPRQGNNRKHVNRDKAKATRKRQQESRKRNRAVK